jgi:hypothetical protein
MNLPETLRMVAGMIASGEKIEFGRDVDLMMRAAAEIERLEFYMNEWKDDCIANASYNNSCSEHPSGSHAFRKSADFVGHECVACGLEVKAPL